MNPHLHPPTPHPQKRLGTRPGEGRTGLASWEPGNLGAWVPGWVTTQRETRGEVFTLGSGARGQFLSPAQPLRVQISALGTQVGSCLHDQFLEFLAQAQGKCRRFPYSAAALIYSPAAAAAAREGLRIQTHTCPVRCHF